MRVLVLEDDQRIASYLAKGLEQTGHTVDALSSAEDAECRLSTHEYEALIVDLMLPGMSGEEFIQRIRGEGNTTPIVILSAKQSVDERVAGLRAGADDYVTKPFSFTELLERLRAIERRQGYEAEDGTLQVGDLELLMRDRRVRRGSSWIDLRPQELALLELLMRNRDRVVPKAVILEKIWNFDFDPQTNIVDVLVYRLRKKIDEPFDTSLIQTVRGVGYMVTDGTS